MREAKEARAALVMFRNSPVCVIVLDLAMSGMDGYEFFEEFSCCEDSDCIPVIVATGHADSESEARALELGAWDSWVSLTFLGSSGSG